MQIWPSLLAANLLDIQSDIKTCMGAGFTKIHLDIMDNHYVPNLSFGPDICEQIHKKFPNLTIDVHLMIQPIEKMIERFALTGANRIAIHANSCLHLNYHLQQIKKLGCQAGIAINPGEGFEHISWSIQDIDYVLVMTVNPGFGGQKMIENCLEKIKIIHNQYPHLPIMVDGGVDIHHLKDLKRLGVSDVVMGSALFKKKNYPNNLSELNQVMREK